MRGEEDENDTRKDVVQGGITMRTDRIDTTCLICNLCAETLVDNVAGFVGKVPSTALQLD